MRKWNQPMQHTCTYVISKNTHLVVIKAVLKKCQVHRRKTETGVTEFVPFNTDILRTEISRFVYRLLIFKHQKGICYSSRKLYTYIAFFTDISLLRYAFFKPLHRKDVHDVKLSNTVSQYTKHSVWYLIKSASQSKEIVLLTLRCFMHIQWSNWIPKI